MKTTFIASFIAFAVSCVANAATINVAGVANASVGLITAGSSETLLSGTAYFYVTTTELAVADLTSVTTRSGFQALLAAPAPLRSNPFTAGVMAATGNLSLNAAEKSYIFLEASTGGYYGIFQGANVPAAGAVTMTPTSIIEDLKGTTNVSTVGATKTGWQLVTAVPEPTAALLGALGALGLLRRRRF